LPPKGKKRRPRGVVDTSVLVAGISGFRKPYVRGKNPSADLLHRWAEKSDFVWLVTEDIVTRSVGAGRDLSPAPFLSPRLYSKSANGH